MADGFLKFHSIEYSYHIEGCAFIKVTCPLSWLPTLGDTVINDNVCLPDLHNFTLREEYLHYGIKSYIFCYETLKGKDAINNLSGEKVFEGHTRNAIVLIYSAKNNGKIKTVCRLLSPREHATSNITEIIEQMKHSPQKTRTYGSAIEQAVAMLGKINFDVTKNLLSLKDIFPETINLRIKPYYIPASLKEKENADLYISFQVQLEPHILHTMDKQRMQMFLEKSSTITTVIGDVMFSYYTTSGGKYLTVESTKFPNNKFFSITIKTNKKCYPQFISAYEKIIKPDFYPFINAVIATPPTPEVTKLLYLYHL